MNPVVPITLPPRFTFDAHRDFRQAYISQPPRREYTVDFRAVETVDSAALGMLLQLREHAGDRREAVRLIQPRESIRALLMAAGFQDLFTIE